MSPAHVYVQLNHQATTAAAASCCCRSCVIDVCTTQQQQGILAGIAQHTHTCSHQQQHRQYPLLIPKSYIDTKLQLAQTVACTKVAWLHHEQYRTPCCIPFPLLACAAAVAACSSQHTRPPSSTGTGRHKQRPIASCFFQAGSCCQPRCLGLWHV